MRGSKSTEVSENEKIKIRKENALELSGLYKCEHLNTTRHTL